MKYLLIRISLLILAVIAINYISDVIAENAEGKFGFLEGSVAFFRFLLALVVISIGIFSYEAYRFSKQNKVRERNISLILISAILLLLVIFGRYLIYYSF